MVLAYAANAALGIIVGWLIRTFVQRSKTLNIQALMSLASLAAGAVVTRVAFEVARPPAQAIYLYPIGALVAILVLGLLDMDESKLKS